MEDMAPFCFACWLSSKNRPSLLTVLLVDLRGA